MELFTPEDNDEIKKKFEPRFGVCGASVIAILEKKKVNEILLDWITDYKGYAPLKEMKAMLEKFDYVIRTQRGHKSKAFPEPKTDLAVVRIQWLKDDGTEFFWAEATLHTHYVLMQKINGEWWIFCNDFKWFAKDSETAKNYLENRGYVSSYLELGKNETGRR